MKLHFSDHELCIAASYWNAIPLEPVSGSNHFFYEVLIRDCSCIMRLTAAEYRDLSSILAELHWMEFVSANAPVAKVIPSRDDRVAVPLEIGGRRVIACVFEKISGLRLRTGEAWNAAVFREWGSTMASLHDSSRQYAPGIHQHRQLERMPLLDLAEKTDGRHSVACKILEEKWAAVETSIAAKDWGMIHCDLTQANMRFHNDRLYIFDFDNCQHAPFLYDIAVTLYVTLFGMREKPGFNKNAEIFVSSFFAGYGMPNHVPVDIAVLRDLLDLFNVLVYLSCRQHAHHPFMDYALANLEHGTLHDIRLENLVPWKSKNQDYDRRAEISF